ncbi:hypothetical protein CPLU01_06719 [Colletotrichum plurivorum]|uniref:Uncharacterized protein n=1 Tax=Colletotrichum plurivorum TaxID=2175906 RepID=A0A8H6KH71_9PEZI|nr:hypothetical protein CPLU01_06719 [Colletotrichum plurivorum]
MPRPERRNTCAEHAETFNEMKLALEALKRYVAVREIDQITLGQPMDPRGNLALLKGVVLRLNKILEKTT